MGEAAKVLARLTFEEYLALRKKAPLKHELVDVMYAMAGASDRHNGGDEPRGPAVASG